MSSQIGQNALICEAWVLGLVDWVWSLGRV